MSERINLDENAGEWYQLEVDLSGEDEDQARIQAQNALKDLRGEGVYEVNSTVEGDQQVLEIRSERSANDLKQHISRTSSFRRLNSSTMEINEIVEEEDQTMGIEDEAEEVLESEETEEWEKDVVTELMEKNEDLRTRLDRKDQRIDEIREEKKSQEKRADGLQGRVKQLEDKPDEDEAIDNFLEENDEYDIDRRRMENYGEEMVSDDVSPEDLSFDLNELERDDFLRMLDFRNKDEIEYVSEETLYDEEEIEEFLDEDYGELEEKAEEIEKKLEEEGFEEIEEEIEDIEEDIETIEQLNRLPGDQDKEDAIKEYRQDIEELEKEKEEKREELKEERAELEDKMANIDVIRSHQTEYRDKLGKTEELSEKMVEALESVETPIQVSLHDKEEEYEIVLPGGKQFGLLSYLTAESVTRYTSNQFNDYEIETGDYSMSVKIGQDEAARSEIDDLLETSLVDGTPEGLEYDISTISEWNVGDEEQEDVEWQENFTPQVNNQPTMEKRDEYKEALKEKKGIAEGKAESIVCYVERRVNRPEFADAYSVLEEDEHTSVEGVGDALWERARQAADEVYHE
jgi:DNA repair exonuclease SbcCD ATPase subunit